MTLRLFERTLANVRTDLRSLYVADPTTGFGSTSQTWTTLSTVSDRP
jgi:hypothetical protein